ncbi:MAG TPA: biotin/lipoyl-containing protein [Cyclobacteriaceae bacterium]|nr:biotin/lipoyl-containing protein [Cyclobacteriaceae bacterium]
MYKALTTGKVFEIESDDGNWAVDGNPLDWDVTSLGGGHFHILYRGKGYQAEVTKTDHESKTVEVKINGTKYSVQLRDKFDLLLEKMGMNNTGVGKINVLKAPMPGLIIDLRVKVGQNVKQGDPLLVLEAMKMENVIKAQGEGTVKQLKIKKGDTVEKNQLLIEF